MKDKKFLEVLRWKLFYKTSFTKEEKEFLPKVFPDTLKRISQTRENFILWIGHNTFLISIDGIYWMTDPIFSKRALLPPRLTPPALTLKEFNSIVKNVNV